MAVYLIADIRIINPQRYDEYRAVVREAIREHGGRYLIRTDTIRVLEGNWVPPRIVVIEFPDRASASAFRDSPAYARARDVCANAAMVDMVMAEGVDQALPANASSETCYYMISDAKVINPERFEEYRRAAGAEVARQGGRYLVCKGSIEVIEGIWQPADLTMVEYPNRATVEARLQSDEYNRSRDLRANAAMVDRILVEGWPPGAGL